MTDLFFVADMTVAVSLPLFFTMHRSGRFPRSFWNLFWCGFAIGLTWELGVMLVWGQVQEERLGDTTTAAASSTKRRI